MITGKKNLTAALAGIVFALGILYYANYHISIPAANMNTVNSRTLPFVLASGILLLSIVLALMALPQCKADKAGQSGSAGMNRTVFRFAIVFTLYVLCIPWLGFFLATALFLLSVMLGFKVRVRLAIIMTVCACMVLYVLFVMFMHVPLPTGVVF